jgi:hypothetical protein
VIIRTKVGRFTILVIAVGLPPIIRLVRLVYA